MSCIPDCRCDEYYNEKYLNERDKDFLRGFDWCAEMAADNFFDNIDDYFDEDSYLGHRLHEELPESMKDEYEVESDLDGATQLRKVETYADLLRSKILTWIEMERDELITSMLDGYGEEEYQEIKERVDGQSTAEN